MIHGALVWVLCSLFSVWMNASGVSLGVSGLFSAMSGLARGATMAVAAGGGVSCRRWGSMTRTR